MPPLSPLGAVPKFKVCRNSVVNTADDCLKPIVFALEILLPATSTIDSEADKPVRAVLSADAKPMTTILLIESKLLF